jgi:hypothetical protein
MCKKITVTGKADLFDPQASNVEGVVLKSFCKIQGANEFQSEYRAAYWKKVGAHFLFSLQK